jgi:hypothetical protein
MYDHCCPNYAVRRWGERRFRQRAKDMGDVVAEAYLWGW